MAKTKKDKKKAKKDKKRKAGKVKAETKVSAKKGAKKSAASKKNPLRALAKRIVELTTANDEAGILGLYADTIESIEMNTPPIVGLDGLRAKLEGWSNMSSDPDFTATNVWVDGNTIVVEWVGDVTLKATGKRARLREIAVHEIENGKIARERYYYDPTALQP